MLQYARYDCARKKVSTMKRYLWLLLLALAIPALAAPPNWDISNTYLSHLA